MAHRILLAAPAVFGLALATHICPQPINPRLHEAVMQTDTTSRTLDTHHLFASPATKQEWLARATSLRRQILTSAGLWPMPDKTPLNPVISGSHTIDGVTVQNVAIQTIPGFYLCGNLYLPSGGAKPYPAILAPYGHWPQGRLTMEPDSPDAPPAPGAMGPGKANLVAIGVTLARHGFVVFEYDMVGYVDTTQATHEFAGSLEDWLWGVSLNGLQLYNSLRALDYVAALPMVDAKRLGITGASGGGTQTFLLTAVTNKIGCSVPVNMVSAQMQGGCLCENGPGLRVGTDNVEIAALAAPHPQLLVAATGDWTKNVPHEEWPTLQKVYALYDQPDNTAAKQFNYQHNYNHESREAMYSWFAHWLGKEEYRGPWERAFTADAADLHVWTDSHARPEGSLDSAGLVSAIKARAQQAMEKLWPKTPADFAHYKRVIAPAMADCLGQTTTGQFRPNADTAGALSTASLIVCTPDSRKDADRLHANVVGSGQTAEIQELAPIVEDAAHLWDNFFTCYNRTPVGDRTAAIVEKLRTMPTHTTLCGLGEAGPWVLFANALNPNPQPALVDANHFDCATDASYIAHLYSPNLRRLGGVQTAAMLCSPAPLRIFNATTGWNPLYLQNEIASAGGRANITESGITVGEMGRWLSGKPPAE